MLEIFIFVVGAFIAGIITFLLPCTYPIVPGYISVLASNASPREVMRRTVFFLLGFSVVAFLIMSVLAKIIGPFRDQLLVIAGLIIIFFGLVIIGNVSLPKFMRKSVSPSIPKIFRTDLTPSKSFVLGAFMSLGWTPCIGPVLASILFLTGIAETYLIGAILLFAFLVGLSFPFLVISYIYTKSAIMPKLSEKFFNITKFIGGITLIILGVFLTTGWIAIFEVYGYKFFGSFEILVNIENYFAKFFESF